MEFKVTDLVDLNIYLSGSIKKGDDDPRPEETYWREEDEHHILKYINANASILNPSRSKIGRNDYLANYGCDLYLLLLSDLIIVDLRNPRGIGVGAELMLAREREIPVFAWVPENSHYKRSYIKNVFGEDLKNWTHPFVYGLCDYIDPTLNSLCRSINSYFESNQTPKKRVPSVDSAVSYYMSKYK